MKRNAGFSLIELLIVIVIGAILASIAVPSYREAVRRSDRRDAQAVMMEIANRERQFFLANRTFADEDTLGFTLPPELQDKYTFTIDVDAGPPPGFEINFDAIGAQAADGDLALDSTGLKTPSGKW
jgi:type IV pilus assembly protein PilE